MVRKNVCQYGSADCSELLQTDGGRPGCGAGSVFEIAAI